MIQLRYLDKDGEKRLQYRCALLVTNVARCLEPTGKWTDWLEVGTTEHVELPGLHLTPEEVGFVASWLITLSTSGMKMTQSHARLAMKIFSARGLPAPTMVKRALDKD